MNLLSDLPCATTKLLIKYNLLNQLVKSVIIENKIKDINVEKEILINEIKILWKKNKINNEEQYIEWLKKNGLEKQQIETNLYKSLCLKKYCDSTYLHKAEARFLERKTMLDEAIYSLIRLKDVFKAKEFYLRLKENETTFEELAKNYSEGPERFTRGIIGPISLSKAHPKICEVLNNLKPGELAKPFLIDNCTFIVRLEHLNQATLTPQIKELMTKELFDIAINDETRIIIDEIKAKLN